MSDSARAPGSHPECSPKVPRAPGKTSDIHYPCWSEPLPSTRQPGPEQAPVCGFFALAVLPTQNTLPSYPLSKHHSPAESNRSNLEPPSTNASGNLSSRLGTGGIITRSFLPHTIQPAPTPFISKIPSIPGDKEITMTVEFFFSLVRLSQTFFKRSSPKQKGVRMKNSDGPSCYAMYRLLLLLLFDPREHMLDLPIFCRDYSDTATKEFNLSIFCGDVI